MLVCIAHEHKPKLIQFMRDLSFIFISNFSEFEMTWYGLDDYAMSDITRKAHDIKTSE